MWSRKGRPMLAASLLQVGPFKALPSMPQGQRHPDVAISFSHFMSIICSTRRWEDLLLLTKQRAEYWAAKIMINGICISIAIY
jgi:hypothetical protein